MINPQAQDITFNRNVLMPIGAGIEAFTPRHLVDAKYVPFINNCELNLGCIAKRRGLTTIFNFAGDHEESTGDPIYPAGVTGTKILGFFADTSYGFIFTGIPSAQPNETTGMARQSGRLYRWNYQPKMNESGFRMVDITPSYSGYTDVYLGDTLRWMCIKHYDQESGDEMILCTNGWDRIIKIVKNQASWLWNDTDYNNGLSTNGKYLASFYDALYIAHMTDEGSCELDFYNGSADSETPFQENDIIVGKTSHAFATYVSFTLASGSPLWSSGYATGTIVFKNKVGNFKTYEQFQVVRSGQVVQNFTFKTRNGTLKDEYAVQWSTPGTVNDFKGPYSMYNYLVRPEDGLPITGLFKVTMGDGDDRLLLGKGGIYKKGQLWEIQPYDTCNMINPTCGITDNFGTVAITTGQAYFNDKGRILDLSGADISLSVARFMRTAIPGQWEMHAVYSDYHNQAWFSSGQRVFIYDTLLKTWNMHTFDEPIQVLGVLPAGKFEFMNLGVAADHVFYSVGEEEAMQYIVFAYANSKLCIQNTFAKDDDQEIHSQFELPFIPAGGDTSINGRGGYIEVQVRSGVEGLPPPTFKVYTCIVPTVYRNPDWTYVGNLTTDQSGFGKLWFRGYGKWVSIRLEENSEYPFEIYSITLGMLPENHR